MRLFYAAIAAISAAALTVIAYNLSSSIAGGNKGPITAVIDYTNVVVILLTTVTVIFSVCALALAVLGVVGFRNLKKDAGKFASQQALSEISSAFDEGGRAHLQIQAEFTKEDGHLKRWVERRIRQEVIALLPLVVDRFSNNPNSFGINEDAPTDEGEVD